MLQKGARHKLKRIGQVDEKAFYISRLVDAKIAVIEKKVILVRS